VAICLVLLIVACDGGRDDGPRPARTRPTPPPAPPVQFQELRTEETAGKWFNIIVVPKGTTWAKVCQLAVYLHKAWWLRHYDIRERGREGEQGAVLSTFGAADRPCFAAGTCKGVRWGLGGGNFKGCKDGMCDTYWLEP